MHQVARFLSVVVKLCDCTNMAIMDLCKCHTFNFTSTIRTIMCGIQLHKYISSQLSLDLSIAVGNVAE